MAKEKGPKRRKGEKESKEQPMGEKNELKIEKVEKMVGFAIIDLKPFLIDNNIKKVEKKYQIFEYEEEKDIFKIHEVFWPLKGEEEIIERNRDKIEGIKMEKYKVVDEVSISI